METIRFDIQVAVWSAYAPLSEAEVIARGGLLLSAPVTLPPLECPV